VVEFVLDTVRVSARSWCREYGAGG